MTWLDAFNEICRRSLASNDITGIGTARSDRYRIYIHLDTEGAWVNGTIRVPQALLDQIISDGVVRAGVDHRRPPDQRRPRHPGDLTRPAANGAAS